MKQLEPLNPQVPMALENRPLFIENSQILASVMTAEEATSCLEEIKHLFKLARTKLLEFKERRGWEALGYPHLTACLNYHFPESRTKLVRELFAAEVERDILQVPIGTCPASYFRPLSKVKPDLYRTVLEKASELAGDKRVNTAHVTAAVTLVTSRKDKVVRLAVKSQDLVSIPKSQDKQLLPDLPRNPDTPQNEQPLLPATLTNTTVIANGKPDVIATEVTIGFLSNIQFLTASQLQTAVLEGMTYLSPEELAALFSMKKTAMLTNKHLKDLIKAAEQLLNERHHPK